MSLQSRVRINKVALHFAQCCYRDCTINKFTDIVGPTINKFTCYNDIHPFDKSRFILIQFHGASRTPSHCVMSVPSLHIHDYIRSNCSDHDTWTASCYIRCYYSGILLKTLLLDRHLVTYDVTRSATCYIRCY